MHNKLILFIFGMFLSGCEVIEFLFEGEEDDPLLRCYNQCNYNYETCIKQGHATALGCSALERTCQDRCGEKEGSLQPAAPFADSPIHKALLKPSELNFTVIPVQNSPGTSCLSICSSQPQQCSERTLGNDLNSASAAVLQLAQDAKSRITKSNIINIFNAPDDQCNRGDILINGNKLENHGPSQCSARFQSPLGRARVVFPPKVSATRDIQVESTKITFDRNAYPRLEMENQPSSILNGSIIFVEFSNKAIAVRHLSDPIESLGGFRNPTCILVRP